MDRLPLLADFSLFVSAHQQVFHFSAKNRPCRCLKRSQKNKIANNLKRKIRKRYNAEIKVGLGNRKIR